MDFFIWSNDLSERDILHLSFRFFPLDKFYVIAV